MESEMLTGKTIEDQAKQLASLYGRNWDDMGELERETCRDEIRRIADAEKATQGSN